jgi:hypothetical protein
LQNQKEREAEAIYQGMLHDEKLAEFVRLMVMAVMLAVFFVLRYRPAFDRSKIYPKINKKPKHLKFTLLAQALY